MKLLYRLLGSTANKSVSAANDSSASDRQTLLLYDINGNRETVKAMFGSNADLIIRSFKLGTMPETDACLIFSDGLADKQFIQQLLMKSLMIEARDIAGKSHAEANAFDYIKDTLLTLAELKEVSDYEAVCDAVLSGDTVLLVDGEARAFVVGTRGWKDRGIEEPASETVIRGPRDGFTETLLTNTMLVRRRIKSTKLQLQMLKLGRTTKTDIGIMYLDGACDPSILKELHMRLDNIKLEAILESGYIEGWIQDEIFSPFPTVHSTERPDVVAAGLLEGRIAVFVDGTPFVLLVPCLFNELYISPEDYYQRADNTSLIRLLRMLSFFIALLGPSAYIAITTFHQEMLPTELLISLASSREGIPFPAFVEALIMEMIFEILREASVRMPRMVGQTMSIVGALVLGQAAIQASLVSPAMVIVVSLTAITNFVIPAYSMAISIRMLRFVFMGLAAMFGLFGILFGLVVLVQHLCALRSFGVPYMAPYAPIVLPALKDSLLMRAPWKWTNIRALFINRKPRYRK